MNPLNFPTWTGIFVCLFFSAMFSGMTIGLFGLSRLRLEVLAETGNPDARRILKIRKDANFLLATLLWGNVGVNVLLTLLTDSMLTGVSAFLFSTFAITVFGEIIPQAFFTRFALTAGVYFIPLVWLFEFLLYPVAKVTAVLLDAWLGKEGITYFKEDEIKILLKKHIQSVTSDIGKMEGVGAVNFLTLDDLFVSQEGEMLHPQSIVALPEESGKPVFPRYKRESNDPFLKQIHASGKKWVIITGAHEQNPLLVLDADSFLREVWFGTDLPNPLHHCHYPVLVTDPNAKLGHVLRRLQVQPEHGEDDVIDRDTILFWGTEKKIITGADLLGRLLRGIVSHDKN
jgi:hypothetical protein